VPDSTGTEGCGPLLHAFLATGQPSLHSLASVLAVTLLASLVVPLPAIAHSPRIVLDTTSRRLKLRPSLAADMLFCKTEALLHGEALLSGCSC